MPANLLDRDPYRGRRTGRCGWCKGEYSASCDGCGGTGRRRECMRADCQEFGCGGYLTCYEPALVKKETPDAE